MKYRVEIAGRSFEAEPLDPSRVRVDGEEVTLDLGAVEERGAASGVVFLEGRPTRFRVQRDERGSPVLVSVAGREIPLIVEDARRRVRQGSIGASASGLVLAPMNGQVVKILRQEGEAISRGDVVLVLEAMKMENEVAAPVSGILRTIRVAQGATVRPAETLFEIDVEAEA